MKLYRSFFAVCFVFVGMGLQAQRCMETHFSATTQAKIDHLERFTEQWIWDYHKKGKFRCETEVYTIPVVVHIVWREGDDGNEDENISDAKIAAQIEILNNDFRQRNDTKNLIPAVFTNLAADVGFEFCLAGITHTITLTKGIGSSEAIFHAGLGGEDAWDTKKYLNIWVAARLDDIKGKASSPATAKSPEEDGVVMNTRYFGMGTVANNSGRTLTHEVGHYFNLLHIWGDTPDCSDDDNVEDTPLQKTLHYGCPSYPQLNCDNEPEMFMNFMDYTDDACVALFTKGQKERMLACLNGPRKGLLENLKACQRDTALNLSDNISIISNPIEDGQLKFKINDHCTVKTVRILNMMGQTMLETNYSYKTQPIDVQNLSAGTYLLSIEMMDKQFFYKKILIL